MSKAIIYDPYLDTLGGGERYCLTVAETLLANGWQVDLCWSGSPQLIDTAQSRFGLKLDNLGIIPDVFGLTNYTHHSTFLSKYKLTKKYDLCFYLSNGSLPFLFSKKNILHTQVPFLLKQSFKNKLLNKIKSLFINQIVYNSKFTANFTPHYLDSKVNIVYPPVDVEAMDNHQSKQNIILSVGRFDNILNSKKQDLMINVFSKFINQNPNTDWKLILMGGSQQLETNNNYLLYLKNLAKNLPIEFIVNPNFDRLKQVYSISKIYWHAAGYGVDQNINPELCEHFGMTPVEAMASGLIPILVNKGGLSEIVTDNVNGYLWNTPEELLAKTQIIINTPIELNNMKQLTIESSKKFSKQVFATKILEIINNK